MTLVRQALWVFDRPSAMRDRNSRSLAVSVSRQIQKLSLKKFAVRRA